MKKILICFLLLLGTIAVYAQEKVTEYKITDRQKDGITLAKYVDEKEVDSTFFALSMEETDPFKINFFIPLKEVISENKKGFPTHAVGENGEDIYYIYYENKELQEETVVVKDGKMLRFENSFRVEQDHIIWELVFRKNGNTAILQAEMANFVLPTPVGIVYDYPVDESIVARCEMRFSVTSGKLTYKTKWSGPWEKVFVPEMKKENPTKAERRAEKMKTNIAKAHLEQQLYDWVIDWSEDILANRKSK